MRRLLFVYIRSVLSVLIYSVVILSKFMIFDSYYYCIVSYSITKHIIANNIRCEPPWVQSSQATAVLRRRNQTFFKLCHRPIRR